MDENSVAALLKAYERQGAHGRFTCRPLTHVLCRTCDTGARAADVVVLGVHHVENAKENAVVAAIRCPACHATGTHVFDRGEHAPEEEAAVLRTLLEEDPGALV